MIFISLKRYHGFDGIIRTIFTFILIIMFISNFDFIIRDDNVFILIYTYPVQLSGINGILLKNLSPVTGAEYIYQTRSRIFFLLILVFTAVILAVLCFLVFRKLSPGFRDNQPGTRSSRSLFKYCPGGLVFRKDLSYILNSRRFLSGILLSFLFMVYILFDASGFRILPFTSAFILLAVNLQFPCNIFGNDGSAVLRYYLSAFDMEKLFLEKNAVFFAVVSAEFIPVAAACLFRYGSAYAAGYILTIIAIAMLISLYGNISSIYFSYKLNSEQGGRILNSLFFCAVWFIPYNTAKSTGGITGLSYYSVFIFLLIFLLILYIVLLKRIKKYFSWKNLINNLY